MKTTILLLITLGYFTIQSKAQYENVWVFGRQFSGLNFNEKSPVSLPTAIAGHGEANASICDARGSLLFYSEGSKVWDRDHNIMPNGTALTTIPNAGSFSTTSSTAQGCMIIPVPKNPGKYYVLSLTSTDNTKSEDRGRLYYSEIDISLNFGRGDVSPGRKGILIDTNLTEAMTAVPGNRCNIWLITYSRTFPYSFKVYEVTDIGISNRPVVSLTGLPLAAAGRFTAAISPDRKKLFAGQILCDMDPQDGKVSNCFALKTGGYGSCFSPDNSKLYVTSGSFGNMENSLIQYDLSSGDSETIANSGVDIGNCAPTQLKLGPDGKIYLFGDWNGGSLRMASIDLPDAGGAACKYNLTNTIPLYGTGWLGLPNIVPAELVPSDTQTRTFTLVAPCFNNAFDLAIDTQAHHIQWEDGSDLFNRKVTVAGSYVARYQLENHSCTINIDTFDVTFPASVPNITILPECRNEHNGKAFASTPVEDTILYNYTWFHEGAKDTISTGDTLSNAPSGPYSLHVHTSTGCDTVLFFDLPEEDYRAAFEVDTLICLGDTIRFVNTSDPHFSEYKWNFADGVGSFSPDPDHVYAKEGTYPVTLVGIGPVCTDTAYKTVTVDAPIEKLTFTWDRERICTGEAISFYPAKDPAIQQLYWDFGAKDHFSTLDDSISRAFDRPGKTPVTLKAIFRVCPPLTASDTVYVAPMPKVDLGPDSVLCWQGYPVSIDNHVAGEEDDVYRWNTGATATSIIATHPGLYILSVINQYGCAVTESVVVKKDCFIDLPNAFSPNGDGINDYFFPRQLLSGNPSNFNLQIFNRWGQLVFETRSLEGRGWDGRFNNVKQPEGVYIYHAEVLFEQGRKESYQGNLTLIR